MRPSLLGIGALTLPSARIFSSLVQRLDQLLVHCVCFYLRKRLDVDDTTALGLLLEWRKRRWSPASGVAAVSFQQLVGGVRSRHSAAHHGLLAGAAQHQLSSGFFPQGDGVPDGRLDLLSRSSYRWMDTGSGGSAAPCIWMETLWVKLQIVQLLLLKAIHEGRPNSRAACASLRQLGALSFLLRGLSGRWRRLLQLLFLPARKWHSTSSAQK